MSVSNTPEKRVYNASIDVRHYTTRVFVDEIIEWLERYYIEGQIEFKNMNFEDQRRTLITFVGRLQSKVNRIVQNGVLDSETDGVIILDHYCIIPNSGYKPFLIKPAHIRVENANLQRAFHAVLLEKMLDETGNRNLHNI